MKLITRSTPNGKCYAKVCRRHNAQLEAGTITLRHPDTGEEFCHVARGLTEMHGEHCILCRYPSMGRSPKTDYACPAKRGGSTELKGRQNEIANG